MTLRPRGAAPRRPGLALALLLALALAAGGCRPYYRDAERLPPPLDDTAKLRPAEERLRAGQPDAAILLLRRLVQREPATSAASRQARVLLVKLYGEQGLVAPALAFLDPPTFDAALAIPALATALGPLAEARRKAQIGDTEQALSLYAGWIADYGTPDSPLLQGWVDELLASLQGTTGRYVTLALAAEEAGRPGQAVRYWELASRYLPRAAWAVHADRVTRLCRQLPDPAGRSPFAVEQAASAAAFLARGEPGAALRGLRRALAAAPCWAEPHASAALILGSLGQYAEAATLLARHLALSRDPSPPAGYPSLIAEWSALAAPDAPAERWRAAHTRWLAARRSAESYRSTGKLLLGWALGLGVAAGGLALLADDGLTAITAGELATGAEIRQTHERSHRYRGVALGLGGAAGLAALVGLPLLVLPGDADRLLLAPALVPDGFGLQLAGALP